jgi:uncharacterized membrane protein YkvA (DUF1232 family)
MNLWQIVVAVALGVALLWGALVVSLYLVGRRTGEPTRLRDVLRLVPDVVRLLRRLAADPALPKGVRLRLGALVVYLVLPIDLIPDFIPVIGYADDAVIVAIALRSVARAAGPEAIDRHWPGTPEGLAAVKRLAGLVDEPPRT